jgi:hypothetical protein
VAIPLYRDGVPQRIGASSSVFEDGGVELFAVKGVDLGVVARKGDCELFVERFDRVGLKSASLFNDPDNSVTWHKGSSLL